MWWRTELAAAGGRVLVGDAAFINIQSRRLQRVIKATLLVLGVGIFGCTVTGVRARASEPVRDALGVVEWGWCGAE